MPKEGEPNDPIYEYRDLREMALKRYIAAGMYRHGGQYAEGIPPDCEVHVFAIWLLDTEGNITVTDEAEEAGLIEARSAYRDQICYVYGHKPVRVRMSDEHIGTICFFCLHDPSS